jgi:formate hydrogenlyase transcriptional activator
MTPPATQTLNQSLAQGGGRDNEPSEDFFRTIIDQIPALAWSCRVDGTAEFLNQRWLDYTGLSLEAGLGWGWKSAIHPDDLAKLMATWLDLVATGAQGQEEARLRRFDGVYRWFLFRAVPVRDEQAKVVRWYGTNTDIEELKRAEEAVRGAKARLEGVLEIAQDAIISVGSNQTIILFNQGAEKIFGYTQAEILGKPLDLLLPKRFADLHRKHIEEFARSPDVARTMGQRQEVSGRRKDGSEFPAEASISKLDLNGEVVFTAILRDITERKRTEQRVLAQYTVTQVLAEAATLEEATPTILKTVCDLLLWDLGTLWSIDRQAGVLRCIEIWHNKSMEVTQFEAITRESTFAPGIGLPGRVWSSHEPAYIPDVARDVNFLRASVAARAGLHAALAFPILLGAEVMGVIDFFSREIRPPDRELLDVMATLGSQIGQFIERKRAEAELRRNEAYLTEAQRLSRTGSFGWKVSSGDLFWSKETFCIVGHDPATKPTLPLVLERVHPEDRLIVQQIFDRAARDQANIDFEHRFLFPDGSVKHVHVMAHPARDESGALEFVGAVSDITATKLAEEQLRQDEGELRRITDAIPQIIGVLAPDGTILYANEVMLDYTGQSLEDIKAADSRARIFHPDDIDRLREPRERSLARGEPFELEFRARRKDGQYRWFLVHYNPLRDDAGNIIRWYATGTDIEDRKQAEERVQKENLALREEIDHSSMFEEIVGSSAALRTVLEQVAKVALADSTVLILGDTGTGKELIARAIHKRSKRATRAFICVNCAAIPPSLIASELFGHEKGAFTGALQRRLGRFELADGGTIFLDEIGELPAETQIALLRVLQEHEIERIGASHPIAVDVRILAATNRDLAAAVASGAFRQDLFYRLNVFPIQMPSLRQRADDIPLLVEYFVERYGKNAGKKFRHLDKRTLDSFKAYDWPGNIRELQNVIERAVILSENDTFSVDETWLKRESAPLRGPTLPFVGALHSQEKEMIVTALAESHGKIAGPAGAAAKLGIPRQTLESKIKRLSIDVHQFRSRQTH